MKIKCVLSIAALSSGLCGGAVVRVGTVRGGWRDRRHGAG